MKQVNLRIYQTILTLLVGLFLSAGCLRTADLCEGNSKRSDGGTCDRCQCSRERNF